MKSRKLLQKMLGGTKNIRFTETPDEALHEVQKARDLWIAAARAEGKTIPLPKYRPVIYQAVSA